MCALYRRSSVLPPVRAALAAGERSMVSFWDRPAGDGRPLVVRRLRDPSAGGEETGLAADIACTNGTGNPAPGREEDLDPFLNLNTREELDRARRAMEFPADLPIEP